MPNIKFNEYGEGLKRLRAKKGMSQKELADLAAIAVRTLKRYESGQTCPDPFTQAKIDNAFNEWDTDNGI